jgi:hypothetical protein
MSGEIPNKAHRAMQPSPDTFDARPYTPTWRITYKKKPCQVWSVHAGLDASVFFGVADFFGVAFFAAAFMTGAFFVVAVVFDLVTRPDLVLPSILGSSTMAGALDHVSNE